MLALGFTFIFSLLTVITHKLHHNTTHTYTYQRHLILLKDGYHLATWPAEMMQNRMSYILASIRSKAGPKCRKSKGLALVQREREKLKALNLQNHNNIKNGKECV